MKSAVVTAAVVAAGVVVPSAVTSQAQDVCAVTGGTIEWGIKDSWTQYVKGMIAQGTWETTGAVKDNDGLFTFEVDPAASSITVVDGRIVNAQIRTKDAAVHFTGHHGILDTTLKSPYVVAQGASARIGVGYESYYVPGKGATEYTPEYKTEANKVSGQGYLGIGSMSWDLATGTVSEASVQLQEGTDLEKKIYVGVDALFKGMYHSKNKPELDPMKVKLQVSEGCELSNSPAPTPTPTPTPTPEVPADTSSSIADVWNVLLSVFGFGAMLAIIARTALASGLIPDNLFPAQRG